jgi:alpha-glucosidase
VILMSLGSRVHVMVFDEDEMVYQVPESVVPRPQGSVASSESLLSVQIIEEPFSFSITRKDNNEILFDTSGSSLIFEDQYLRLRTSLPPEPMLYGLGEHTDSMMLNTTNYTRTLWCRDSGQVPEGSNLYGAHPVYFENRPSSGGSHGVVLLNSNGMDIKINSTQDRQYLEYNTLGGVVDLYFVAGPDPFDVARQYSEIAGRPAMVPYWGFGFHQCRFGYRDVYELAEVVANYSAAGIPLETMWADIVLPSSCNSAFLTKIGLHGSL